MYSTDMSKISRTERFFWRLALLALILLGAYLLSGLNNW